MSSQYVLSAVKLMMVISVGASSLCGKFCNHYSNNTCKLGTVGANRKKSILDNGQCILELISQLLKKFTYITHKQDNTVWLSHKVTSARELHASDS